METPVRRYAADLQCSVPKSDTSLSVMATVPSSWPTAGASWPPTLDGGEGRHKIEQPTGAGCSRSLAEASSCSPADGSSYIEVANSTSRERIRPGGRLQPRPARRAGLGLAARARGWGRVAQLCPAWPDAPGVHGPH